MDKPLEARKEETRKKISVSEDDAVHCNMLGGDEAHESSTRAESVSDSVHQDELEEPNRTISYYVSSRHLIVASPWFRRALAKEKWSESVKDEKDNLIHLEADDWDSDIFLVLMNIIHLENRKVPQEISLEGLAKMAVLVDYYECDEAVEHFTDKWKQHLGTAVPIPATYCRDLTLWIWIAWVFDWQEQFGNATLIAVKYCSGPMDALGLPIPERVTGETLRFDSLRRF